MYAQRLTLLALAALIHSAVGQFNSGTLFSGHNDNRVRAWNATTGTLIRTMTGHSAKVNALAITADGALLFSGSIDDTIIKWNASTGANLLTFSGHTSDVRALAITPDGVHLFSGSEDTTIKKWKVDDGTVVATLTTNTGFVQALGVSPSGSLLVSGADNSRVMVFNAATGAHIHTLMVGNAVYAVAVPFDDTAFSAGTDLTVTRWNITSGTKVAELTGHTSGIFTLLVHHDGTTLFSGAVNSVIIAWNMTSNTQLRTLSVTGGVYTIAASPQANALFIDSNNNIIEVDGTTGNASQTLTAGSGTNSLVLTPGNYWTTTTTTTTTTTAPTTITAAPTTTAPTTTVVVPTTITGAPQSTSAQASTSSSTGTVPSTSANVTDLTSASASGTAATTTTSVTTTTQTNATPTTTAAPPTTAAPVPVELLSSVLTISSSRVNLSIFGPNSTNATLAQEVRNAVQTDLANALGVNRTWIVLGVPRVVSSALASAERTVYSSAENGTSTLLFPYSVIVPADDVSTFTTAELVSKQSGLVGGVSAISVTSLPAFTTLVASVTNTTDLGITASAVTTSTPDLAVSSAPSSGLSGGAIAGIVIGVIAAVAIAVAAAVLIIRNRRSRQTEKREPTIGSTV